MLKNVVNYYEKNRKTKTLNEMRKFDNLVDLQKEIEAEEGRKYSLAELSDCVTYVNQWNK